MARTIRILSRLFNIRRNEWPRFALIYLIYFLALTGMQWGRPVIEAAFLTEVGVTFLPWVFVINALVTIVASAIYTAFADRVSNTKLLVALFGLSVAGIMVGLLLLVWNVTSVLVPLLLLFLVLNVPLQDIFNIHWPTYVNGFYDTQAAKRTIPLLASGARIAGIVAGLTLPWLNTLFQAEATNAIILIWLATLVVAGALAWFMPQLLHWLGKTDDYVESPAGLGGAETGPISYRENIREGFRYVAQAPFLRWLALAALLTFVLLPLINYQSLQILEGQYQSKEAISNFIARLNVVGNVIALPIQLFVLNRVITRLGLGNTSLIFPLSTLAISSTLIFFRTVPAAALGYLNGTVLRTTFRNPVDNLLYNAIPLRIKGRARAFIVGLVVPLGGLLGGLLLLAPAVQLPESGLRAAFLGLLAVALVAVAVIVRRQYSQALITMLAQEDFSFLIAAESNGLIADAAAIDSLKHKLAASDSPELTIFVAQLLSQVGGNAAVPILSETARATTDSRVRAAILEILSAANVSGREARWLYTDFLADPAGPVRQAALLGLERLAGPDDEQVLSLILGMVQDPALEVRVQALSAVAHSGKFYQMTTAFESVNQLLASRSPQQRAAAVQVLGEIGDYQALKAITEILTDPADEVRLAAAEALDSLTQAPVVADLQLMLLARAETLRHDPVERVRQIALTLLGRLGDHSAYEAIVEALTDASPPVRTTAVEALVLAGKAAIPTVHPKFDAAEARLRKMATVVLSRIDPKEYGPLINTHITNNLLTIYQTYGQIQALTPLADYPSVTVLRSALSEQNEQLRDEIFYLLTAIHPPEDVRLVAESLASRSSRVRANAAEALESLTSPQTSQLIVPLFEVEQPAGLIALSRRLWQMQPPDLAQAVQRLLAHPETPYLRAMMTFALGEVGASLVRPDGPEANGIEREQTATQRVRNLRSRDLLGVLADEPAEPEPQAPPPPADRQNRRRRHSPADLLGALADDSSPAAAEPTASRRRPAPGEVLDVLTEAGPVEPPVKTVEAETNRPTPPADLPFGPADIEAMLDTAFQDSHADVRLAARAAKRTLAGFQLTQIAQEEVFLLSPIEKIIFLKEVPFFQGMTIQQLEVLANICEEKLFAEETRIFEENDPGGALYVVVSGRVGIEQERRKGSSVRLATLGPRAYFGETSLFDDSPRSSAAIALQDTLTLRLRREPLIALARQHPEVSLELITVLSERLREAHARIAELTRTRPRQIQKLYDKFDE